MNTVVIGSGPAGSACALWLHQFGHKVQLVEKSEKAGGLQKFSPYENVWMPSIRGLKGRDVADNLNAQLIERGIPLLTQAKVEKITRIQSGSWRVHMGDGTFLDANHVVLATGAKFKNGGFIPTPSVSIGPGNGFENIDVSGKSVAILGGGDNAFDAYMFGTKRGAKCTIFARTIRAQKKLRNAVPSSDVIVGAFDANQNDMKVNGLLFDVFCVQFGFEAVVPNGLDLKMTSRGYVETNILGETTIKNIYAVGEVANLFHPCVSTSFAHGIQAAKAIQIQIET
jgi:thioredoxin reductase